MSKYYKFSQYLKNKYGEKVYKLPLNVDGSCPNKDGTKGTKGCIFCGEESAGFECVSSKLSIREQLQEDIAVIADRYRARKFIAYFQNWSATYRPVEELDRLVREACIEGVVAVYLSTRPDCVDDEILRCLKRISDELGVDIVLELGLQSTNEKTLKIINRGHTVDDFIKSVEMIHGYGFEVCTHLILNLPWDTRQDVIAAAKLMNELKVEQVKCHSLFVLKDTVLGDMYEAGEIEICPVEEYMQRVKLFLENLSLDICVQRLLGRSPEGRSLFCNWGMSWKRIHNDIEAML